MTFAVPLEDVVRENRNELLSAHANWERVRLGDVAEVLNGYPFPSEQFSNDAGTPLLRIRDVVRGRTETYFVGEFEPTYVVKPGELVVGMDGDFNCARWRGEAALLNQRVCKLTPNPEFLELSFLDKVLPGYLDAINAATSSMTVKHLSSRTIADIPLPLPSRREQRRLVEKLDELLSDLDAGIAALERARANLKRYRAAVLKAAVEGRLTEKWRAKHPKVEPAEKLLERILVERRKKWEEAQLKKYAEKGQSAPKGWKDRYPEAVKPNLASLPTLPSGWIWASLEQLIVEGPQNGLYLPKEKYGDGIPILRIDDYQNDSSRSSSDLQQVQASSEERETYELRVGDILVNRVNSPSHLGKCIAIQERHVPALFESNMMRFAVSSLVRPDFVVGYLRSVHGRVRLTCNAKWAVNQASINQQDILKTPVPLPSPAEQSAVVEEMEHRISVTAASELEASVSITRSALLRQSILKRAFEGKLVPQDPKDEPASELLARIRADRAAGTGAVRRLVRNPRAKRKVGARSDRKGFAK